MQWSTKKQATNFDVVVVGKICGETSRPVRFHGAGAVCGSGCGLRAGKILPAPVSDKIFVEISKVT